MVEIYQNKEWLEKKYWDEELSTRQIGKLCVVSDTTIRRWMRRYDISFRSISEAKHLRKANHCNLSKRAIEWLNGELLGDGSLSLSSIYSANFVYSSKYREYIQYVKDTLESFGVLGGKIYKIHHKKLDYYSYSYRTLSYSELLPIYRQWYPEGKKIVPKDIKLTPLTCKQWHIGDGCLMYQRNGKPYITLATCGFSMRNVMFLINKLKKLNFKTTRQSHNIIYVSTYSTKDFLDYIGECPVFCYQYKFVY